MPASSWLRSPWVVKIWAVLQLTRPFNVMMIVIGVGVGGLLSGGAGALQEVHAQRLLLAALAAACIGAAGNSINDVLDLRIDRINRPERPLPSGRLQPVTARVLWLIGSTVGVALAALISNIHLTLALATVGLLVVYSVWLKRLMVVGNVVIAALVALALVFGGWAVGPPEPALVGAGFAFLTTWVRELIKDQEDADGDATAGVRTLPLVAGAAVAQWVTIVLLAVTLLLSPLPFLLLRYTGLFLLMMLLADALMLRAIWLLLAPENTLRAASTTVKAVMLAGMAALACDALFQVSL